LAGILVSLRVWHHVSRDWSEAHKNNRFDYSGACNLIARRLLVSTKYEPELLYTPLDSVPETLRENIPASYDLYKELTSTFEGMYTITSIIQSRESSATRSLAIPNTINRVDAELYRLTCLLDQIGPRSRRRYLQQYLYILTLIYTILLSSYEEPATEALLHRFESTLAWETSSFGNAVSDLFRQLLAGEPFGSEVFA
jgi:hypothetical protein